MRKKTIILAIFVIFAIWVLPEGTMRDYFLHRAGFSERVNTEVSSTQSGKTSPSTSLFSTGILFENERIMATPSDDVRQRIVSTIDSAEKRVYLELYLLTEQSIIDALINAKKRWLDVRVVLEKEVFNIPNANRKSRDMLANAGISVASREKDRFNFIHTKTLVTDNSFVVSTGNYTKSTFASNREFFIFSEAKADADFLAGLILSDFYGEIPKEPIPERFYISPDNSRKKLLLLLDSSEKSIDIFAQSLSDDAMIAKLKEKSSKGIRVRVCLRNEKSNKKELDALKKDLESFRISFTLTSGPTLHAKTIRTERILAIGSENFTSNSLDRNREIGMFFPENVFSGMYDDMVARDCKWR